MGQDQGRGQQGSPHTGRREIKRHLGKLLDVIEVGTRFKTFHAAIKKNELEHCL